jgi:putative holliday junction resolvase
VLYFRKVPKIIGIDFGTKRVGVAVTDDTGSVAFPKTTLTNDRTLLPAVTSLVRTENASVVVIGESKNAEGQDNEVMRSARRFAQDLENHVAVTVRYEPEFYTSVEARRDTDKREVDAEAAAILLNSYITRTKKQ